MHTEDAPGSWDVRKDRFKEKFPQLTDTDLILNPGNREEMIGNLRMKLGLTEAELHQIIITL